MFNKTTYSRGVIWMLIFNLIARGISFILGIILANNFLPIETDVYLYIWSFINVVMVIISTINLMVIGPEYIRLNESGSKNMAADLSSAFGNLYMAPILLFSIIIYFFPVEIYEGISGLQQSQLKDAFTMLKFSGLWLALVVLNNFIGNILLSKKYFIASVFGQVLAATITLFFILLFKEHQGIHAFFLGQIIGNVICLAFYLVKMQTRIKDRFKLFYFRLSSEVVRNLIASILISLPTLVTNFLVIYLLSNLVTGQLSAYNYGSVLANLPDVIILSQFISIVGVKFSEISANESNEILFRALRYFGNHLFFIMSFIAVLLSLLSPIIIHIFYGKENLGELGFNSAILTLAFIAAALPFKALDALHNRMFASLQALPLLMKYTLPIKILSIGILYIGAVYMGLLGILLYQLLMPILMVMLQLFLLSKYLPARKLQSYCIQLSILFLVSIFIYVSCRLLFSYMLIHIPLIFQGVIILLFVITVGWIIEKTFKITMVFDLIRHKLAFSQKGKAKTNN